MAKLILASVLCIFLLVKGTEAAEAVTGASCASNTCEATDYCENDVCKIKVAQTCVSGSTTNCILHASCPTSGDNLNKCTCDVGYTANNDKTVCETKITTVDEECSATDKACDPTTLACQDKKCKKKIEQVCRATDECVAGAECPSDGVKQCSCTGGLAASPDMTKCGGAMGVAASMLLVMATFVTSRFL